MTEARIAITGTGAICAAGLDLDAIWSAITQRRSAIAPITEWDTSRWPVRMAGCLSHVSSNTLVPDRKTHKFIDRIAMFGLYAGAQAFQQSGLGEFRQTLDPAATAFFNDRSGVFVGSGAGGGHDSLLYEFFPAMSIARRDYIVLGREFPNSVNPMLLLKHLPNNVLCHFGIRHGFKGANSCIVNHAVGGALAIAEAAAAIRAGEADRAAAIGHDKPLDPEIVFYYDKLGLLAKDELRPFDRHRRGTILGEGAAALILESAQAAHSRGATVLGEYLGSGCTTEASGVCEIRADGDGLSRAIRLALQEARIAPEQVGMIVAHGNGTRASDASEATAIRAVFGRDIPPMTAFKWAFGHLIAASGALDAVLALRALRENAVPGVPTLRDLDPELAPLPISCSPQKPRSNVALIHSRGFGGTNVALLVRAA